MTASHVPAPWEVCQNPKNDSWYRGKTIGAARETDARRICDVWSLGEVEPGSIAEANARRIVACVNACEGIETEVLEKYWPQGGLMPCAEIHEKAEQRDQLLAALEKIVADPFGCPMCDSGKLRSQKVEKSHWDTCGFDAANKAIAAIKGGAA